MIQGTKTRKPLQAVHPEAVWVQQPVMPCEMFPDGLPGMLLINDTPYQVHLLQPVGYRLVKSDGTVYDVDNSRSYWTCDCPDGTYRPDRPNGCKLSVALREALRQVTPPMELPKQPPPRPPQQRFRSTGDWAANEPAEYRDEQYTNPAWY